MALPSDIASPSNISYQINRILVARDDIRRKLSQGPTTGWGISEASGVDITALASIIQTIAINDNIDVDLMEGDTYNIPKGYHTGAGVVKGVAGGGNYTLQAKTVSAGRSDITVVPDQGKYGLSSVKVNAIPSSLQDVSYVTATAGDVLAGKNIVTSNGTVTAGTMVNNGTVTQTLSTAATAYTIPQGYHSGSGKVSIKLEEKTTTPSTATQTIVPTAGSVLSKVTVNAIPSPYFDVSGVTAQPTQVLTGTNYVNSSGSLVAGTMANKGSGSRTLYANSTPAQKSILAGYYDGTGSITISSTSKTITPTKASQQVNGGSGTNIPYLGYVIVEAIPSKYQDVTGVTAAASQVLAGTSYVTSNGTLTAGTMTDRGAVSQTLSTTSTQYTVPQGYHDGRGIVKVVTETKSATPSTNAQTIVATAGKVLSSVSIAAIPSPYYDVSGVTARASDVLTGKKYVNPSGTLTNGMMADNSAVSQTLSTTSTQYTVPQGYHNGSGIVKIVTEDKTLTPAAAAQTVYATAGKVINKVTVNAIPSPYYNTSGVTAVASHVLTGEKFVNSSGTTVTGTMADNSAVHKALTYQGGSYTQYTIPSGYHNGAGTVTVYFDDDPQITPSTTSRVLTPILGAFGKVTVNAIPSPYYDVSGVTAAASQVLAGTSYVTSSGALTSGTMTNQGAVSQTLSTTSTQYTVPQGYHNGSGTVKIVTETKSATPSTSAQTIVATSGKVISSVSVAAIPTKYKDTTGADAVASQVLTGKKFVNTTGTVTGSMANIGSQVSAIDGLTVASKLISQGYHDGTGFIYLTNDIEIALASI